MNTRVSARSLLKFGLFVIIYTGFGGTLYFLNGRLQELGILFVIVSFTYVALLTALNIRSRDFNWSWWLFAAVAVIVYTMLLPAFTFARNTGASMLPSVFASRDFLGALLAPLLYFAYRAGLKPDEMVDVIMISLGAIVLSYLFHYYRIDLAEAYRSPIAAVKGMITYDDWRGYRLKGPNLAHAFSTIAAPVLMIRERGWRRLFWCLVFLGSLWAWYLIQARAQLAALIVGVILYHFWFARKNRLPLFYLGAPALVLIMAAAMYNFVSTIHQHDSARYLTIKQASEFIVEHPLFGFGRDNEKLRERELMHPMFYSSDIGILGVAFRAGIPGAVVLIFMLVYALRRAVTVNWIVLKRSGRVNILLFWFVVQATGDILNIFLSAVTYIKITGVLTLAIAIGLTAVYRHYYADYPQVRGSLKPISTRLSAS